MRLHLGFLSLAALLATCSLAVTAQAGTVVVDTFDQGSQTLHVGGTGQYDTYTGSGPLGGDRFLYARNVHSVGGGSRIDINNAESTPGMAKLWLTSGASARTIGWGKSGNNFEADFSAGNELNLNFGDNDTLEIDVAEVIDPSGTSPFPQVRIWANGGTEVFEYRLDATVFPGMGSATTTPQTLTVQLNTPSFGTFNSGDLDNVDGIRLQWYDGVQTVVSEVRATGAGISGVPEPSSFALAGLGLVGLAGWGLRRRRQA